VIDNDVAVVTIKKFEDRPHTLYFFPPMVFIVLLYFNRAGIQLDGGYVSALLGVAIVSLLVESAFIGFGIITDEWYSIAARGRTMPGEIIIGVISLFSTQFTWFIAGFNDYWIPRWSNVVWFMWGFIIYQFMWLTFTYIYVTNGGVFRDNRANVFFGMLSAILIGIGGAYFIFWVM